MGGAATCLLSLNPSRRIEEVDLVVHVDHRMITAGRLTTQLLTSLPSDFDVVNQFGHTIPAYRLGRPGQAAQLVELEVFDYESWPQRPQYNVRAATRKTLNINGQGRQGSAKEATDIRDIMSMIPLAAPGKPELDFNQNQGFQNALANLLQKRPALAQTLKAKIKCGTIFQN
ncbi:hypothetical protein BDV29DRAFT_151623 [Aspergillus leporis]|uniref:Uncharacterized protein n=1 Tax=Aspergillus leporis TaxID=41062 RepID=A0A5N5XHN4_9EURO|nr:hypothetical protein BDV29DRAFT_151623 [Aspergillus leporis]